MESTIKQLEKLIAKKEKEKAKFEAEYAAKKAEGKPSMTYWTVYEIAREIDSLKQSLWMQKNWRS